MSSTRRRHACCAKHVATGPFVEASRPTSRKPRRSYVHDRERIRVRRTSSRAPRRSASQLDRARDDSGGHPAAARLGERGDVVEVADALQLDERSASATIVPCSSRTPSHRLCPMLNVSSSIRRSCSDTVASLPNRASESWTRVHSSSPASNGSTRTSAGWIVGSSVEIHHQVPRQRVAERGQLHHEVRRLLRMEEQDVEHVRPDIGQRRQQRVGDLSRASASGAAHRPARS